MRVRVNYTIDFDLKEYREKVAGNENLDVQEVRRIVQNTAIDQVLYWLGDEGVKVEFLGNNDPFVIARDESRT